MKTLLTEYQYRLLLQAFNILESDMSYEQEEKIIQKTNCSVGDLYELRDLIELILPR